VAALAAVLAACPGAPAAQDEVAGLIAAAVSADRPVAERAAACDRLRHVGDARAAAALAPLLEDEAMAAWARHALESMPCPEAGAALRGALGRTTGALRAGVIDSLGDRRDREALPALLPLVADADALVAASAAGAVGRIGGPDAARALLAADQAAPPERRAALADALLVCAEGLAPCATAGLSSRVPQEASSSAARLDKPAVAHSPGAPRESATAADAALAADIYRRLTAAGRPAHVQTAGWAGVLRLAGPETGAAIADALTSADRPRRDAALARLYAAPPAPDAAALTALLPRVAPPVQCVLLDVLARRGERSASPAVLDACRSPAPAVRLAALEAAGTLADASALAPLADMAAAMQGDEQEAARRALARLRGEGVREVILAAIPTAAPLVRAELVQALGRRGDTQAVASLLAMAASEDAVQHGAAAEALAVLAGPGDVAAVAALVVRAPGDAERAALEKVLGSVAARSESPAALADPVLAAAKNAPVPARCALLRSAARMGGPNVLAALRAAVRDADATVADTGIRTLADTAGPDAAADLLALAKDAPAPVHRVLALRGYWRMVGAAEGLPAGERWAMCKAGMAASGRPEERRLGLAELAKTPHPDALAAALAACDEPGVRTEAQAAAARIAAALAGSHPAEARAALARIAAEAEDAGVKDEVAKAREAMDRFVGYVSGWQAAGPYRAEGKECSALFDIEFPPETPDAAGVAWKPAAAPPDPALAYQADLAGVVKGDHAVAYLKARVFLPQAGPVRLEIGTDDGVKAWVNGRLVHSNNAIRGLTPGQDHAQAEMAEGWNTLLLKITQHTLGCGACVRVRRADGSVIEGMRCE
jgi:HEAT repeat protein